ncbi:MAG TPA: NAD(P)-dependent oxidoreductase, partial [Pseudonocardiaceae bacterium]|nr:NAD(P)-dependent oxidoreductase [Pseudonocardiaceae bacterium]
MRVTVLGLGNMGRAFATRALARGHRVTVWNRTAGRVGDLVARGATVASTVSIAVAEAAAILVVVADDEAALDVCLGIDGALASVARGAVLVNCGTVSPDTARELAEAGPTDSVLDAPVMGAPAMIEQGAGRFLIGGPPKTIRQLDPLLADLGAGYLHCGPAGTGATMKLMLNLQLVIGVAALAEAIATARAEGIDDDLLRAVFADSPVLSPATRVRQEPMLDPAHPGWFSAELARKDVRLAVGVAEQRGVPVRLGPATENLLTAVLETNGQWPDF